MSKVTNRLIQEEVDKARRNIEITTIFNIGVSNYKYLEKLKGPTKDIKNFEKLLSTDPATRLYKKEQIITLSDPTSHQLRECILNFSARRSARGDIVIFYFSGHGGVIAGGDFVLCTTESRKNQSLDSGLLSTSGVLFTDVVRTFSSVDIRPFFIFDACFSGTSALSAGFQIGQVIQNDAYTFGSTYGLLCSSNPETETKDLPEGGIFTLRLCEILKSGIDGAIYKNKPILTISDVSALLIDRLAIDGSSLPRLFIGSQLPEIAIAKNVQYSPESESFTPQFKKIIELLWNNGNPREVEISEILDNIGTGAYANYSKLNRAPWNLLEQGSNTKKRKLTDRGIDFAEGNLSIPKKIIKDPITWDWIADPESSFITIDDIDT